jgi:hypothetical protein
MGECQLMHGKKNGFERGNKKNELKGRGRWIAREDSAKRGIIQLNRVFIIRAVFRKNQELKIDFYRPDRA